MFSGETRACSYRVNANRQAAWPLQDIVFTVRLVCTNQYYPLQTPPLSGHCASLLHRTHWCAIYVFPSTTLYCNVCHTILLNNQQVTRTQDTPTEKTPPTPAHTRARQEKKINEHLPQALNNARRWREDGACHLPRPGGWPRRSQHERQYCEWHYCVNANRLRWLLALLPLLDSIRFPY